MLDTALHFLLRIDWVKILACYPLYIGIGFAYVAYLGLKK